MQAGTGDLTKWFWVPASVPTISSDYKSVGISLSMAGLYPPKDAEIQISDRHLVVADCPQDGCGDSRWTGYSTICVYGISDICFSQSSENAQSKGWPSAFVLKCLGSTNSQFILALQLKICYSTPLKTPFSFAFFFLGWPGDVQIGDIGAEEQLCTYPLPAADRPGWVYRRLDPYLSCTAAQPDAVPMVEMCYSSR